MGENRRESKAWVGALQERILKVLAEAGRPLRLGELSQRLGVDVRRVHSALSRLVERGIVVRRGRGLYEIRVDGFKPLAVRGSPSVQERILKVLAEAGRPLRPREISSMLGLDGRSVYNALSKLVRQGLVVRRGWGLYGLSGILPAKETPGLRPPAKETLRSEILPVKETLSVEGPFFDNVRGYGHSGRYIAGDRGRALSLRELGFFEKLSYAEVLYRVSGPPIPGVFVVYVNEQDGGGVRFEWRPPKGYVKKNGVMSAVRMYFEVLLNIVEGALRILLSKAPADIRARLIASLKNMIGPYICTAAS